MKRFLDVFFSAIGLLFAAPMLIIIAVLIKLYDKGPVFYKQKRVGRYGNLFEILKFRTMTASPTNKAMSITVGNDPRITKIGALLRKSKADELPQLINVLAGEMSLVGPRPEVPEYSLHYPDDARAQILSVRPGITDNASIEFRNESQLLSRAEDPEQYYITEIMPIKQKHYLDYVNNQSISNDFKIILMTFLVIIRG